MPLMKFEDFYSDYQQNSNDSDFGFDDIKGCDVYVQNNEKVGTVTDVLVNETDGRFRYFVVDTGFWIFGKKVLLPVGSARINQSDRCINVPGLTKEQVENLPNFDDLEKLDFEHEEHVRNTFRPMGATGAATAGLGSQTYDRNSYSYDRDPDLYNLSDRNQQSLKLYEERLVADKRRQKTGEVVIGKQVQTEQAHVSIPVERERVVVERVPVSGQAATDTAGNAFNDAEIARVSVYEETPDVRKEAFVREEVQVKKVSEQETVEVNEELRREELDMNIDGKPSINR